MTAAGGGPGGVGVAAPVATVVDVPGWVKAWDAPARLVKTIDPARNTIVVAPDAATDKSKMVPRMPMVPTGVLIL